MKKILAIIFSALIPIAFLLGSCSSSPKPTRLNSRLYNNSEYFSSGNSVRYLGAKKFFGESKVHKYVFANGLKLLILEDHTSPTFAYHTWFNVGSRNEQTNLTGLAHLFEHMMFKATKNHSEGEFFRTLESSGAKGQNAFTSHDYTTYIQSLPIEDGDSDSQLSLVASMESDRMVNLVVNEQSLATEREVVQNERRFRQENNPDGKMYEKMFELAFTKHPYHWPVIGYEQDLKNATAKDCLNFYKKHYGPSQATIVIVGDVNPKETVDVIEDYYGDLEPNTVKGDFESKFEKVEPRQKKQRKQVLKLNTQVEKLQIGYHIPDVDHIDIPTLFIIKNLLTEGKSSRLQKTLVDAGIASQVDILVMKSKDPGLFFIAADLQKGRKAEEAIKVIDREMRLLRLGRVKKEEIARAVSQFKLSTFEELQSAEGKAMFLGLYETIAGEFERGLQIVNAVTAVDRGLIKRVAKAYLNNRNQTVIVGIPTKNNSREDIKKEQQQ